MLWLIDIYVRSIVFGNLRQRILSLRLVKIGLVILLKKQYKIKKLLNIQLKVHLYCIYSKKILLIILFKIKMSHHLMNILIVV